MTVLETYHVYYMKEKVAQHFYYKSELLFQFLKTYHRKRTKKEVQNQFCYVTKEINVERCTSFLQDLARYVYVSEVKPNHFYLHDAGKSVDIHVENTHITITCDSIHDAEHLLFEPLRSFPIHVFVAHAHKNISGWISTLKQDRQLKSNQAL